MHISMLHNFLIVMLAFLVYTGCADTARNRSNGEKSLREPTSPARHATLSGRIEQPAGGQVFTIGEDVNFELSFNKDAGDIVSVQMTVDGNEAVFSGDIPGVIVWNSGGQKTGSNQIRIVAGFEDERTETYSLNIVLKSDIAPVRYSYRILNSYPHDIRAFTQGLVYHEGFLYESTGQYGQSTLRKVDLETGVVLRSLSLDRELFGEGLCVHDGRLYQLTWKSRVGFIYDIESFRMLSRVHYQTEGWGLTSDGTDLIKSDGSHILYYLDPQYFSETGRIEVFDHNGRVDGLNELEYIDGTVYANVFGTDEIVMVELKTGRVTGIIDLTGLLDRRYHHPNLDVLNGIAYDHDNDRLFVTGKNWPRLFEIEIVRS